MIVDLLGVDDIDLPLSTQVTAKLRTILAAAWACACQNPPHNECADNGNWCLWCEAEGYNATCTPDCPHRQLQEALADD